MRACWTLAHIPRLLEAYGSGTATSAHGACMPYAARPRRTAAHFFPHTRPPDSTFTHTLAVVSQYTTFTLPLAVGVAYLEYRGFLVNTYSSLVLRSMGGNDNRHRKQPRPAARPATRPQDSLDSLGNDTLVLDEDDARVSDDGARDTSISSMR